MKRAACSGPFFGRGSRRVGNIAGRPHARAARGKPPGPALHCAARARDQPYGKRQTANGA
ncbi:MAG: hypothetical protein JWQ80_3236 [Massilia sp.]|nr:hypothetical protein [Massilia sp.]